MKALGYFLICVTSIVLICACTKKITNDSINILAPANNAIISTNAVTFWWDPLDGADNYNIQVVQPSFASVQNLIADTNVTGTKLLLSLNPGTYQWRIKGINGGGNTKITVFNFRVDSTSNLSGQLVVPIGPAVNFVTANSTITFSWSSIATATDYQIEINGGTSVVDAHTGLMTSYTSSFVPGSYNWKVKALNGFSISQFNSPRLFKIDQTAPGAPSNLAVTSAIVASTKVTDTLTWIRNSTDVQYDSVYFYTDAALTILSVAKTSTITKIGLGYFLSAPSNTLSLPYWWRVKSVDSVGNRSPFSTVASFTLTP